MFETKIHLSAPAAEYTACGIRVTANVPVLHDAIDVTARDVRWHVDCYRCLRTVRARQIIAGGG